LAFNEDAKQTDAVPADSFDEPSGAFTRVGADCIDAVGIQWAAGDAKVTFIYIYHTITPQSVVFVN
jgi:hypothetical protein